MVEPRADTDRDDLVVRHAPLVDREAARYRTWRVDRDDLRQAGFLGLLIAARRFEPGRGVPFPAYAHTWVRKEIQRAVAQQEFPAVVPADLVGRTVAVRRALAEHAGDLELAAAALGISPDTVAALDRQVRTVADADEEDLVAPGYAFVDPEHRVVARSFAASARTALARMEPRQAEALVLRYGLDGQPERSFRQVGRELGVADHTARKLVERAQAALQRLID
jgi:RNA polymerase sigma factor (sigma-70 family)